MERTETENGKNGLTGLSYSMVWWLLASALAVAIIVGLGTIQIFPLIAVPLAVFVFGLTLAAALQPMVSWLERWMPRLVAMLLVYLLILALLAGLTWIVVPSLVDQIQDFASRIPDLTDRAMEFAERLRGNLPGDSFINTVASQLSGLGGILLRLPLTITSIITGMLLVMFISFYMLLEAGDIQKFFLSLFPRERRSHVSEVASAILQSMGGYVRGVVINGVIVGVLTYVGLELLGINFALTFGVLSGVLELVPVIGPIVAGAIIVGFTLLQSPGQALIALIFVIVMQQIENNVLVPNIMRNQTDVSPLLSILALSVGAAIGGLMGALIAIPVAGALRVLVRQVIVPAIRSRADIEQTEDGRQVEGDE